MELAARQLRTSSDTVGSVARGVGYASVYGFNRAFRRHRGHPRWTSSASTRSHSRPPIPLPRSCGATESVNNSAKRSPS
jgi:hypothetical protein